MGIFKKKVDWAYMTNDQLIREFQVRRGEIKRAPARAKRAKEVQSTIKTARNANAALADDKTREGILSKIRGILQSTIGE